MTTKDINVPTIKPPHHPKGGVLLSINHYIQNLKQNFIIKKVKVKVYSLVSHTMYVSHDFTIYQIPP